MITEDQLEQLCLNQKEKGEILEDQKKLNPMHVSIHRVRSLLLHLGR